MATASPLLGPPSLRDAAAATASGGAAGHTADASQNDHVSAIADETKTGFNLVEDEKPMRGFTENMSATFLTTGNPCLDFFFKVVPDTPRDSLIGLLEIAWAFNPLMALKLICNLRGVRGTGKSDKERFYAAALWLHHVHPKTLAGNVKAISEFGYFKDFLEILYRILEGPTVRETQKAERPSDPRLRKMMRRQRRRNKRSRRHYHGIENQSDYGSLFSYPDRVRDRSPGAYEDEQLGELVGLEWETLKAKRRANRRRKGYQDQPLGDYEYESELENEDQELGDYEANEDQQLGDYEYQNELEDEDLKLCDYEYQNELENEDNLLDVNVETGDVRNANEYENELENEDQELGDYEANEDQELGFYEYKNELENEGNLLGVNVETDEVRIENEYQNELENEENLLGVNEETGEVRNENEYQGQENNAAGNENKEKTERKQNNEKEEARALRKEKERSKAKKALEMYNGDEDYRRLHDSVAGFFHELLKADLEKLKSEKLNKISLAAKWCPSIDSSYDKATLICESIARKMFPKEMHPEYEGLEDRHYVYRVRDRLRKDVLVPLHKALELPEVYMSANKWNALPYNRVPSVAMKKYQKLFSAHDKERFGEYLENVKSGKEKIAAGALLPHEIIKAVKDEEERQVAELQWKRLVDDMIQKGKLSNCIAVCDVSGSMYGIPMEVSVALGILVSELSEEPWKGKLITFSDNPEIQTVQGESLLEKTEFVENMAWGMSTNFQGVFDRILEIAVEGNLKEEQLVKQIFVFSDMEFNRASSNPWETDYQAIQRKYSEHGYNTMPEIVFWNLRDSRSIPVAGKQTGVALVSGFSKNLLNIFLDGGGGIVNPVEVMELAVAGEEYKELTVFD